MYHAFFFGMTDELEKQAGIKTKLKGALSKARRGIREFESSAKSEARMRENQGARVAKAVGGRIKEMKPGKTRDVLRRGAHEVRKALHERKATLDPQTAAKAKKGGIRVVEKGAHSPKVVRNIMKYTHSSADPLARKAVVGGRAKEAPEFTKHEVGHLSGRVGKSPAGSAALGMATRVAGPMAAKGLARLGKGRSAKAVQALSSAGTLAEEGRAWKHSGVGGEAIRKAKKGDLAGAAKKLKPMAIGLGSYARKAKVDQKAIREAAAKATRKKLRKKFPNATIKAKL